MVLFAYLDPGTGSLVLQVIVGGILGVGVILKAYWTKIMRIFGKGKKNSAKTKKTEDEDAE
jgi:hypothetical protein